MKYGIVSNSNRDKDGAVAAKVSELIEKFGGEATFDIDSSVDVIISIGGDGTFLSVIDKYRDFDCAFIGVNRGSVGFLTDINNLEQDIKTLVTGDVKVIERSQLKIDVYSESGDLKGTDYCLNDVMVCRGSWPHVTNLDLFIDGEKIETFRGDGIVVATATGSTAYSLAAGGPILMPYMQDIIVTPVCSNTFYGYSYVTTKDSVIEIGVGKFETPPIITPDGRQFVELSPGDSIRVTGHDKTVKTLSVSGNNFFTDVKSKILRKGSFYE